jgi:anti-sigma factor RsiW
MNNHDDIRKHLSAYSSGDIDPSLATGIGLHLASCDACRAELAELKTSLRLLRSTPEVEAPPWLTARTMARVRALQSEKRSWLQRIFFPLQIKLPLEAMALLMVCVTGWYISRSVETELKQPTPQQSREIPPQVAPTPAATTESKEKPGLPQPSAPQLAPPPALQSNVPKAAPQSPAHPARDLPAALPDYAPPPPSRKDEQGVPAPGRAEPARAAPAADSWDRSRDAVSEKRQDAAKGVLRNQAESLSPSPAGRSVGRQAQQSLPQMSIRLNLTDPVGAPDAIREVLVRSGGSIADENELQRNRIKARIPAARIDELLQRLERMGRLAERPSPPPGAQLIEVTIQWQ